MRKLYRQEKGFTLIEILVVIVIIGVLATMGVSKYTEFTTDSRRRSCISNQTSIDKAVGVWESQQVAITKVSNTTLRFNAQGRIVGRTGTLPPGINNDAVRDFVRDDNVFLCAERSNAEGGVSNVNRGAVHFEWLSLTGNDARINNTRRGVYCLSFVNLGPDGTANTRHR